MGDRWAATLVGDNALPPDPGTLTGLVFFAPTAEDAEAADKVYLGASESGN